MAKVKEGLTYKEIDSFSDGSKIYEKHNLNGAKAVKTVNADGKTTQVNIELADKSFRRTSYNPVTGKPVRTVTNTTKNGDTVEIIYDDFGQTKAQKVLNAKKSKTPETAISITNRSVNNVSDSMVEVTTNFSDGSLMKTRVDRYTNETISWTKWKNPDGNWDEFYSKDMDSGIICKGKRVWFEDANGFKRVYEKRTTIMPSGIVQITPYARLEDKMTGLITNVTRMNFPKSSPVKRVEEYFPNGSYKTSKAIVRMKNGTVYELKNFKEVPSNRELRPGGGLEVLAPQNVVKISKDGTKTEMKPDEIMPWLESFHPDYNFSLKK